MILRMSYTGSGREPSAHLAEQGPLPENSRGLGIRESAPRDRILSSIEDTRSTKVLPSSTYDSNDALSNISSGVLSHAMALTLQLADADGRPLSESYAVLDDELMAYLSGLDGF